MSRKCKFHVVEKVDFSDGRAVVRRRGGGAYVCMMMVGDSDVNGKRPGFEEP